MYIYFYYSECTCYAIVLLFQVHGVLWRSFYFGSTIAEEFLFFKGENRFTLTSNDMTLITEFSGEMYVSYDYLFKL